MKKINNWVAEKITIIFSTMWCFYVFVLYGLTPLKWPQYMDKILYWSNFVQLIALPALAVGNVVLARRQEKKNQAIYESQEKRAQETHDTVMQELVLAKEEREDLKGMFIEIHQIREEQKHA